MELERRNERNEISDVGMKLEFVGGCLRVKDDVAKVCGKHKKGKKTADEKGQENRWPRVFLPLFQRFPKKGKKTGGQENLQETAKKPVWWNAPNALSLVKTVPVTLVSV